MSVLVDGSPVEYARLPVHLRAGMERWVEHGIPPGTFLKAVLENNLVTALATADGDSRLALDRIAQFVHWGLPHDCHGSRDRCKAWANAHGRVWAL